ncbi:MAG: hypothetical protein L0Y56_12540, partial [Nitrospira sp.]|nr:hypothetical protein [Nitrospira sp.]
INNIEILSLNRTSIERSSTNISITQDTTLPSAPAVSSCGPSSSASPCTFSGNKEASESIWINDRLVVGPGNTSWSYDVTLTNSGSNTFEVRRQDAAGNKSSATSVIVNFSGTLALAPALISPLGNTGVVSPTFRWSGSSTTFRIQISPSVDFSTLTVNTDVPTTTFSSPLSPGRYFWRVGSMNSSGIFYTPARKIIVGYSLCDFDKDGFDDLIVGSYENDVEENSINAGRAFVYRGGPSGPDTTPDMVLTSQAASDRFGISVACAGDVNKDGFSDIIVGAFLNDGGGENAGRAYIFFGGSSLVNKGANDANVILTGQAADDRFGTFVSAAGDVNGDGYDDVIVGAYSNDSGGANAGRAYLYFGGDSNVLDDLPDAVLSGEAAGDQFGIRVARAGDVNGDSYDDVIVGADGANVGNADNAGKAYLFFGSPNMAGRNASQADAILQGNTQDAIFASVNGAGDLNNDGYSDVVVGASGYPTGSSPETGSNCRNFLDDDADFRIDRKDTDCYLGRAYVFLGGPTLTGTVSASAPSFTLSKPLDADGFGFSVSSAGDINGDGFSDLLIGAFLSDKVSSVEGTGTCTDRSDNDGDGLVDFDDSDCVVEDEGRAYLYFGGITVGPNPSVTFIGEAAPGTPANDFVPTSGQFGFSLAGAGDVNGDGVSDLIIGAYLHDIGIQGPQTDVGRVYIFRGALSASPTPIAATTANHIITGSEGSPFGPDNGFGISVQ